MGGCVIDRASINHEIVSDLRKGRADAVTSGNSEADKALKAVLTFPVNEKTKSYDLDKNGQIDFYEIMCEYAPEPLMKEVKTKLGFKRFLPWTDENKFLSSMKKELKSDMDFWEDVMRNKDKREKTFNTDA